MIVRINQIDPATAETLSGWGRGNPCGAIESRWPAGTFVYQILVLDQDEYSHSLASEFRQNQIRQLIPKVIKALSEPSDHIVLRLDGLLAEGELLSAFRAAADPTRIDRFSFSATEKFGEEAVAAMSSIRLLPRPHDLPALLIDGQLGLERSVRLRAFALEDQLVNPLLDAADVDDERWREILPRCRFVLSTAQGLLSLVVWTMTHNAADARRRIMEELSSGR
jgi:hypothetical protein